MPMKKALSLPHLVFYGIGMILGAGIYSIIGKAAGVAQEGLWVSFLLAAFCAALTALSYAELATLYPQTGGEYIYLKNIFPTLPYLSLLCGSMMVFAGISTAATVAMAFAGYMQQFVSLPTTVTTIAILFLFTVINIIGIKESSWMNIVFTLIEISGLILFITLGMQSENFGKVLSTPTLNGAVFSGAALVIFAYFGFENIVNLVEESREPQELPKGILISVAVSTVLYLLVSLAALALGSPQELATSDAPLSDIAGKTSPSIAKALGGIAMFSTANTVLISMLSTSRVIFSMAREKDLPQMFAKFSAKRSTPWMASVTVFVLALTLLPVGGIEVVASASSFATMFAFSVINLALIHLRFVEPEKERSFKVPFSIGKFPVLTGMAALVSIVFLFFFKKEVYFLGAFVFIVTTVVYFISRRNS
ncbi:APC family permease [uncultured Bdellovibrio sp.]|uniref:APC family permease n=1 Tax=Bdellovibrio sp. HCB-162 TaxID=3394234 RepID=UPI0025E4CF6B|nr:APC family permease [uncultured Bdellovibrio sp.]